MTDHPLDERPAFAVALRQVLTELVEAADDIRLNGDHTVEQAGRFMDAVDSAKRVLAAIERQEGSCAAGEHTYSGPLETPSSWRCTYCNAPRP